MGVQSINFASFKQSNPYALTTSLVGYWNLNEASGNALDSHSNALHLTDNNTVGASGSSRDFEVDNTEYFNLGGDNANLSGGTGVSLAFSALVQLESKGANRTILSKYVAGAGNREYLLYFDNAADRFRFLVSNDGTATASLSANNLGSPSTATPYFVIAWHDATADTINIQINNGTTDSAAHSTNIHDSGTDFCIGAAAGGVSTFDGLISKVGVWRNRILTSDEKTYLYNSGSGRVFSEL